MKDDVPELQSLLQPLAQEKLTPVGPHRTPDELAAYHFHQLSATEEEQIQDHLVTCRACTMLLLDLAELCVTEPEEAERARQTEAAPASFTTTGEIQAPATHSFFQRLRDLFFSFHLVPALAALLLVLSLTLVVWALSLWSEKQMLLAQLTQQQSANAAATAQQIEDAQRERDEARTRTEQVTAELEKTRREAEELSKPQLNAPILTLLPGNTRSDTRQVLEIPSSAPRFILVIPATEPEPKDSEYAVEILKQGGAPVFNEKGLRYHPESGFTLLLPSRLFPAGEYRIQIYRQQRGTRGGTKERVAETIVQLQYK